MARPNRYIYKKFQISVSIRDLSILIVLIKKDTKSWGGSDLQSQYIYNPTTYPGGGTASDVSTSQKMPWMYYVPLRYYQVALLSASTVKSLKITCWASFFYENSAPYILKMYLPICNNGLGILAYYCHPLLSTSVLFFPVFLIKSSTYPVCMVRL